MLNAKVVDVLVGLPWVKGGYSVDVPAVACLDVELLGAPPGGQVVVPVLVALFWDHVDLIGIRLDRCEAQDLPVSATDAAYASTLYAGCVAVGIAVLVAMAKAQIVSNLVAGSAVSAGRVCHPSGSAYRCQSTVLLVCSTPQVAVRGIRLDQAKQLGPLEHGLTIVQQVSRPVLELHAYAVDIDVTTPQVVTPEALDSPAQELYSLLVLLSGRFTSRFEDTDLQDSSSVGVGGFL